MAAMRFGLSSPHDACGGEETTAVWWAWQVAADKARDDAGDPKEQRAWCRMRPQDLQKDNDVEPEGDETDEQTDARREEYLKDTEFLVLADWDKVTVLAKLRLMVEKDEISRELVMDLIDVEDDPQVRALG